MIDIQEPQRRAYTEEEKAELSARFILLLHTLLLVYLSVHNIFIPLVSNLLKGQVLLQDVHYWFLFQLPVQYWLRKGKGVPSGYFLFLIVGSITRITFETLTASTLKSWGITSIMISELSSFIFYFVYWPRVESNKWLPLVLAGFVLTPLLSKMEIHGQSFGLPMIVRNVKVKLPDNGLGCQGTVGTVNFPVGPGLATGQLSIKDCGLSDMILRYHGKFEVKSNLDKPINLRLYRLNVLHGRVSWRFVRLVQVEKNSVWDVTPLLKDAVAYLIKSPERKKIGHTILLPATATDFPLGIGKLNFNYDSLEWVPL